MKVYILVFLIGGLLLPSTAVRAVQTELREATVPANQLSPAIIHALAPVEGGDYQLHRISTRSTEIVWDLTAPLLYGSGYGRLVVMDVHVEGNERRNRLTVIDVASGAIQHQSFPDLSVAHDLSGVAPGIVFREGGRHACVVTRLFDQQTRLNTGYFVTCLDTMTGATNQTPIPQMSGPTLVQLEGDKIGVAQRGLREVMVLTFPERDFKTVAPSGLRQLQPSVFDEGRVRDSKYLYLPETGLIWASEQGKIIRVADSHLKSVSATAQTLAGGLLLPQRTRFSGKPALIFGRRGAGANDISGLVIVNTETFAEDWREPMNVRVRSFAASEDGREVALIDADSGMLKRYLISTDSYVDVAVIPSASAEDIRVLHVVAEGEARPTAVNPSPRE